MKKSTLTNGRKEQDFGKKKFHVPLPLSELVHTI